MDNIQSQFIKSESVQRRNSATELSTEYNTSYIYARIHFDEGKVTCLVIYTIRNISDAELNI